jgi:plastocyanin
MLADYLVATLAIGVGAEDHWETNVKKTWRLAAALVAVLAVIAAGCGDDDDDGASDGGGGDEITIQIDGKNDDFSASYLAFFPDKVTVHPGDTIVYESNFSGEPHSIAFGSIVTDAVTEFRKLTPEELEAEGPPPPALEAAFEKIPPMLPEGPGDAIQSSVNPCFVVSGELPSEPEKRCEVTEPEPFTGKEVFYNSGFLADGERFELQLADDIVPGTYVGFCTLHFVEMTSDITVVAEEEDVPSADEVADEAQEQFDAKTAELAPVYEEQKDGTGDGVQAGAFSEEVHGAFVTEFLPKDFDAKVGDPVTFTVEGHTVTFGGSEDLRVFLKKGDDGAYHLNEPSMSPAGFDAPPPPEEEGEGPPPPVDAGTWDGTGLLNSGIMFGGEFIVRFSKAGTYEYICTIHPEMEGSISVS